MSDYIQPPPFPQPPAPPVPQPEPAVDLEAMVDEVQHTRRPKRRRSRAWQFSGAGIGFAVALVAVFVVFWWWGRDMIVAVDPDLRAVTSYIRAHSGRSNESEIVHYEKYPVRGSMVLGGGWHKLDDQSGTAIRAKLRNNVVAQDMVFIVRNEKVELVYKWSHFRPPDETIEQYNARTLSD